MIPIIIVIFSFFMTLVMLAALFVPRIQESQRLNKIKQKPIYKYLSEFELVPLTKEQIKNIRNEISIFCDIRFKHKNGTTLTLRDTAMRGSYYYYPKYTIISISGLTEREKDDFVECLERKGIEPKMIFASKILKEIENIKNYLTEQGKKERKKEIYEHAQKMKKLEEKLMKTNLVIDNKNT